MGTAKDIIVKPISSQDASRTVKKLHYSGKSVNNSQLHFGVFIGDRLEGVMSFGPSMDKSKVIGLVAETKWNGFLELNRMAFSDALPRNSESRAISIALRIIKKNYPHIEWVISYADGTQCGDGTIYRASGFVLTQIKKNSTMIMLPWGETIANLCLSDVRRPMRQQVADRMGIKIGSASTVKPFLDAGAKVMPGYQFRYMYFINKDAQKRLKCDIIPFAKIKEMGVSMYKGKRVEHEINAAGVHPAEGGVVPTHALQPRIDHSI